MKRTLLLLSLVLVLFVSIVAQETNKKGDTKSRESRPMPTVEQILDKYVQSVGGRAAVERVTSRFLKGSLVTAAGTAPLEIYEKLPNKFLVMIDSPAGGISFNGFNGSMAWSQNKQSGVRERQGPDVESFKREYDIHREIKLKDFYPKMNVKGKESVGSSEGYVLELTSQEGTPEVMYFDAKSGLLLRHDVIIQDTPLQTYFEDYKDVDGVKLPFTIRKTRQGFTFTYKFAEIRHNTAIEDAKFEKPAS